MLPPILFLAITLAGGAQEPSAPEPLPLGQAIELARAASLERQAAEIRADAAARAERLLPLWPNPTVETRAENWTWARPLPGAGSLTDVFAVVTQPIEIAAKRRARIAAAGADRALAAAEALGAERAVVLDTVRTYMDALRARESLAVLRRQREELGALLDNVAVRVREGFAPEADLLKFRSEAARVDTQVMRAELDLERARLVLTAVVGEATLLDPARLVVPAAVPSPERPADLARRALEVQTEIMSARARVDQARRAVALERLRRVPDPTLSAGYKGTGGQRTGVIAVQVPLPLFDRNRAALVRALADERAAVLELQHAERQLLAETTALFAGARALAARAATLERDLIVPAREVRDAARAAFREGAGDVLTLVDAERVYREARRDAITLAMDTAAAVIQARVILGQKALP